MQFIDSHAHLYAQEFDLDRLEVISRAKEVGVSKILLPNIDTESIDRMMDTYQLDSDYFSVMMGLHPTSVKVDYQQQLDVMKGLIESNPDLYVAIGEVGLDYYWDKTYQIQQLLALEEQLNWALFYNLPVVLHCRDAYSDLALLLQKPEYQNLTGVIHSFSGSEKELDLFLPLENWFIGLNGIITFKNSGMAKFIKKIPLERLLIETDCPYLTPVPYRGKRNESAFLYHTLSKIAVIYAKSVENMAEVTLNNTIRCFGI